MKKKFISDIGKGAAFTFVAVIAMFLILGASGKVNVPQNSGLAVSKTSKAYADAQVDTVIFAREPGLAGLSFGAHFKDSVNVRSVVLRRVVDGIAEAVVSTDTLWQSDSSATAKSKVATITLAPLPDVYWVIVTYATNNGGLVNGVTTPTAVYEFNKQYYTK